jgi:intracellular septation protein
MRFLIDFLPLVLFFGAYQMQGIYVATGVMMAATTLQMALNYAIDRKLQTMHQITLLLVLVFGTLTLVLQDERFIKWKPTVLYTAIAFALAIALWGMKKNFLKLMLGAQLELPDGVWQRLNIAWIAYSLGMAALNAYVASMFSTEAWVSFKLWGYAFPLVFLVLQGIYIAPHLKSDEPQP